MRDDILNILKNTDKALDIYELQSLLGINNVDDIKKLSEELIRRLFGRVRLTEGTSLMTSYE